MPSKLPGRGEGRAPYGEGREVRVEVAVERRDRSCARIHREEEPKTETSEECGWHCRRTPSLALGWCATSATVTENLSQAWQTNRLAAGASRTSGTLEAYRGDQAVPIAKREAG